MAAELNLIIGRVGSLETELARRIAADQADDPLTPVAVLIGGSLQRPYLQRRIATHNDGILNVHFLMASEIALRLGQRAMMEAGRSPLPALGDRVLLGRIASEQAGYFEPVSHSAGFADALHRTIREVRQAGIHPEMFRASLDGACEVPEKAESLASIYEDFLEARSGFYGPEDCMPAADLDPLPWASLHVVGITDPPAALERLLLEIGNRIGLTVYLPTYGTEADEAAAGFRDRLVDAGAVPTAVGQSEGDPASTLAHAQANLFGQKSSASLDDSLHLLSAPDPVREIREVARACLQWADEGLAFHEMAIVYRHADAYRPIIESVFNEAGVPLYLHEGSPLIERPLGRRIAALLGLAEKRFDRRSVMDFIADADLPQATRERFESFNASRWDRASRDAGVVEGAAQWRQRLDGLISELTDREESKRRDQELESVRGLLAFVTELFSAIEGLPATATWPEHLAAFGALLDTYVKDVEPVVDALDGLHRIGALEAEVSAERFRELVTSALEGMRDDDVRSGRAGAFARRGVNVLDVNSLRLLRFRALALVGLTERDFPSPPSPDPLLLDHERIAFNRESAAPLPLRVLGPDPEPLQLTLAVEAAGERLLASFPRKGAGGGNAQLPSIFFRVIAESVVGHTVRADEVDSLPNDLFTRAEGSRIGARDIDLSISLAERDRTLIEASPAVGREVLLETTPRMKGAFEQRRARLSTKLTPFDGVLPAEVASLRSNFFPDDRQLSPSALEAYAACPQRFFLGSFLRLSKIEEPESVITISPLDRGTLIHRILERFLSEEPRAGEAKVFGAGEPARLSAVANEEFANCEARGVTGYELTWNYAKEEILEDLARWLDGERNDELSAEMPEGDYETRFGFPWRRGEDEGKLSSDDQLEVAIEGLETSLHLGGRIDRLSWNGDRTSFRVIDYKTGSTYNAPKDGELKGGRALQLPLYLLAGAQILGIDVNSARGSAEYHYPTRKGAFHRSAFTTDDLWARREELEKILATAVGGIRAGTFQMDPADERDCTYCDFNLICPSARHQQIERKAADKAARPFQEMREIK